MSKLETGKTILGTEPEALEASSRSSQSVSLLEPLLRRSASLRHIPERIDGILTGRIVGQDSQRPRVAIEALGVEDVAASTLIPITEAHIGQRVALGFEAGNPDRPIILGVILDIDTPAADPDESPVRIERKRGRTIIHADGELELRCGKAVIRLQADGRVTVRGVRITSHATATQRIRGGSVHLN